MCLSVLLGSAAHAAAIRPDGTHIVEIGLSRGGTAQADVLANGGIYEIKVQLSTEAVARYAIVPSTVRWTCTDGSFAGETDGQTTVTWLSPDRGEKTEQISVSGKLRPLGDAGGPGDLLDFAGQVEAKIYEPIILLESEPQFKAEGQSQTYAISGDIWAEYGDEQESIAATLTVRWLAVGAQEISADKAHFDNGQASKTVQTTDQWVSTDLTLALPTRRGEEYLVAALVAVSEAKLQTAIASLSESITIVGVEIEGADEPLDLQIGDCVTLSAVAAPSGGDYTWTFSHTEDRYVIEDTGEPSSICIRFTRPVQDFVADVQYTRGTVTAPSLRWLGGQYASQSGGSGTFQSDAVAMSADGFSCVLQNVKTVCGIDGSFSFVIEATTDDPDVLIDGLTVTVGNWTATDAGPSSVNTTGLLPFYFQFTVPAEEIGVGVHSVTLSPNSEGVAVLDPEDEDSPLGDAKVAVIHARIQGHDDPEWRAKGDHDAVTLEADVQGPSDGLCQWSQPEGVTLLSGVAGGPGATSTITVSFTAPGRRTIALSYKWPLAPEDLPPGADPLTSEFGPTLVAAVREEFGLGDWVPDDAVFYVMALGPIEEVAGQLDGLLETEQCTLQVQETPALALSGGGIEWRIDGASGTFDPDYSTESNQTTFSAGSTGGTATVTAKYTATLEGRTVYTESSKRCNIAGLIRTQLRFDYAVVGQTMDMEGRPTEITAETGLTGGAFQVLYEDGPGCAGEVSRREEGDKTIFLIGGSTPGPTKLKIAYMVTPEGSPYAVAAGESIVAFTVYQVKVNWTKEPRHNWVSEGDTVTLTARVFGDPGSDSELDEEAFDASTVQWDAFISASRTASGDGEQFVLIQAHHWHVTASVRVQRQGSEDPPEEMASTEGAVEGVRLHVVHPDPSQTIAKGEATTVSAAIDNAPGPIDGEFIWTCDSAEFYKDDSWVAREARLSEDTAQVRFDTPAT